MSTEDTEYHAVITGAAEGLGVQSMMKDLRMSSQVRVWTDTNTAKAIALRRERSWKDQTWTKSGRVKMERVPAGQHLADHLTKITSWSEIDELIRGVGGQIKVSHGHTGNAHRWKKCQGGKSFLHELCTRRDVPGPQGN